MSNAGKKLRKWPQLRGLTGNDWAREYQRLRAEEKIAAGLTVRGKPRKLNRWPELHGKTVQEQNRLRERARRLRLAKLGLTARGTVPKYHCYNELAGLSGKSRQHARLMIWYGDHRNRKSRSKVGALLKGAFMTAKLRRAA
jgi:hypothetical protein